MQGEENKMRNLWGHDFDNRSSSSRLLRSLRPLVHVGVAFTLFYILTEKTIKRDRKYNEKEYKDPISRNFTKFVYRLEPHYYKYLDLIPVYNQEKSLEPNN